MAQLDDILVYPIKALDPVHLEHASFTDAGGLAGDRIYGIVDADGAYIHGKRTAAVHRLHSEFDLDSHHLTLTTLSSTTQHEFDLQRQQEELEAWLSDYFETSAHLEHETGGKQTDGALYTDASETGPTLVSAATVREVASWFEGIAPPEMLLRIRPNLVVSGVPAFWEDKLLTGDGGTVEIGDVVLRGVTSVPRCVVPVRDPQTGEEYERFREIFVERREETLPEWADEELLDDNLFSLTTLTRVPRDERGRGQSMSVGDSVQITTPVSDAQ